MVGKRTHSVGGSIRRGQVTTTPNTTSGVVCLEAARGDDCKSKPFEKGHIVKKLSFLLGFGVGCLLGSRAGSRPYQQLEARVRSAARRPEVQDVVKKTKEAVHNQVAEAVDYVGNQLSSVNAAAV
jgi:hypothetical protein